MYIAMNRFTINSGKENDFENIWRNRKSYLDTVPGFVQFKLLRGATTDETTTFVSHSQWESEQDFINWTNSEAFTQAHKGAKTPDGVLAGPPKFEGYNAVDLNQ